MSLELVGADPPLDQCSICSAHYIRPKRIFCQPDVNRQICKLLEIDMSTIPGSRHFFSKYVPVCDECSGKIKRFEKLRVELDILKGEVVSSVLDTLLHIRSEETTPLDLLKRGIIQRWNNPQSSFILGSVSPEGQKVETKIVRQISPKKVTPAEDTKIVHAVLQEDHSVSVPIVGDLTEEAMSTWLVVNECDVESAEVLDESMQYQGTIEIEQADSPGGPAEAADDNDSYSVVGELDSQPQIQTESKPELPSKTIKRRRNGKSSGPNANVDCENNPPPFFCDSCGRTFSIYKYAMHHMKTCDEDPDKRRKICIFCSTDFSNGSWYQLKLHYDAEHPGTTLTKCRRCKLEIFTQLIGEHVCKGAMIKPPERLECELCNIYLNTQDTLQKHVMRRHKDLFDKGDFMSCDFCQKPFVLKSMLERHRKVHTKKKQSKWQCEHCNVYLSTRSGLKQHLTLHTGEMAYECDICHKRFRMLSVLRCHRVVHTKERNHECDICGEKFGLFSIMLRHWKRHKLPPGDGVYKCPVVSCYKIRFRRVYALKEHMTKLHPDTDEYEEVMRQYEHVDDRGTSKRTRDEGRKRKFNGKSKKSKVATSKKKKTKSEVISDEEEEDKSDKDVSDYEKEVSENDEDVMSDPGSSVNEENEESPDSSTLGKRSARIAARKGSRKFKREDDFVYEDTKLLPEPKKYKAGPKSKTQVHKVRTKEKKEGDKKKEKEFETLNEHSDLLTIKDEPVDEDFVNDTEENADIPDVSETQEVATVVFSKTPKITLTKL